jgi:hypothetical protein
MSSFDSRSQAGTLYEFDSISLSSYLSPSPPGSYFAGQQPPPVSSNPFLAPGELIAVVNEPTQRPAE